MFLGGGGWMDNLLTTNEARYMKNIARTTTRRHDNSLNSVQSSISTTTAFH
jgi:hypothetical protein